LKRGNLNHLLVGPVVIGAGLGREAEDHISILRNWDQKRAETTRCHGLDTGGEKKKKLENQTS
jgi:hypothetical protein